MRNAKSLLASVALIVANLLLATAYAETFVTIGTGGPSGVYYQVGSAICDLVNRGMQTHDIRCTHTIGGSTKNINDIRAGKLDIALAQSDWQFHAYHGTAAKQFPGGPYKELRAMFSVHQETFTVLARANSGIQRFEDLRGKRVNIGNPGSGQRATMEVVMEQMGWKMNDFALVSGRKSSEQAAALCDNEFDAIVFVVGHPNGSIQEATTSCDSVIVAVDNDVIDKLVADNPYYSMARIPGGIYKGTDNAVTTFDVGATVVASSRSDAQIIYQITKSVFDNFPRFRQMHPALANLEPAGMIVNGLSAPLHDGALKYFKEKGLLR